MDAIDAKWWLDLAQWLITAALALWVHLNNRQRVTQEKIDELDGRLDNHEARIISNEKDIQALPTTKEFRVLQSDIKSLEGDIKALTTAMEGVRDSLRPINHNLDRINSFLLSAKS